MNDRDRTADLFNRALQYQIHGQFSEALSLWTLLLRRQPTCVQGHVNCGVVCLSLGKAETALARFENAIRLKPNDADIHNLAGIASQHLGRADAAAAAYQRAIAIDPALADAHYNHGTVLQKKRQFEEAIASYDRALHILPQFERALSNKGSALQRLGRFAEAVACYDRFLEIQPRWHVGHTNKATALVELKLLDQAQQSFAHALALKPDAAETMMGQSACHLLLGRYDEGWRLYEARKRLAINPVLTPALQRPHWLGDQDLDGKTLLIHAEQGLGDTIQFCRYALLAREKGAKVILSVPSQLMRLLGGLGSQIAIVNATEAAPVCDFQIMLMSLPLAFHTVEKTIPAAIPHLSAEPARVRDWAARIGAHGFKIGIAWQGNPTSASEVVRSIPLACFIGLSTIPGVRLISLQKFDGIEQLQNLPAGMAVESLGEASDPGPDAFVDTAAVMESLDLVITSDTAIAHLAGAMGRPGWIALKYVPDWRWQLDRSDSPWYPSLRLFRQSEPGDWASVFAQMEGKLRKMIG